MSLKISPLSEGVFTVGHDTQFHPFDPAFHELNDRSVGSLLVEIQPFLIQTGSKNILLDTGLGFTGNQGELQLLGNLKKQGLEAGDINLVLLSHLHKDHAGGISQEVSSGHRELTFPNARYCVGRNEFNYGAEKGFPSYIIDDFSLLKNSSQTEWLEEKGNIGEWISYEEDGGHCPHHISYRINTPDGTLFFGGDVVPQLKQLKTRYMAKYDWDGRKCMELRQTYLQQGTEEHWTFLFYHDVQTPYYKF